MPLLALCPSYSLQMPSVPAEAGWHLYNNYIHSCDTEWVLRKFIFIFIAFSHMTRSLIIGHSYLQLWIKNCTCFVSKFNDLWPWATLPNICSSHVNSSKDVWKCKFDWISLNIVHTYYNKIIGIIRKPVWLWYPMYHGCVIMDKQYSWIWMKVRN